MQRRTTSSQLTTLLTVALAFALFGGAWLLASPAAADHDSSDSEQVVRSFYDAINEAIRTGNSAALDEIIARDVTIHSTLAEVAPDRAGLVRYVTSLHESFPHLELTATDIVITGDRAIADVNLEGGSEGAFLGGTLLGGNPWGETDAFRIADHEITEIWSGAQGAVLFESKARAPFDVIDPPERAITLDRLTIPVDGSYAATGADERRWLFVEASTVTASSLRPESTTAIELGSAGASTPLEAVPTEQRHPETLEPGDFVPLPVWGRTEIRNVGSEPARLLVLAAGLQEQIFSASADPAGHSGQGSTEAVEGWPGWLEGTPRVSKTGAMLAQLTGNVHTALRDDRTTVVIGQMTLAAGSTFSVHVAGPHLLSVDTGTVELLSEGEPSWIYQGRGADLNAGALGPGAGAMVRTGSVAHLLKRSDKPATVTVVALVPTIALDGSMV